VTYKTDWSLWKSIALAFAVLVTPSLALGQGAASCFDGTAPARHALGETPEVLPEGVGSFHLPDLGTAGLTVHYVRPQSFSSSSSIVLVIPGAGRNSDDYRDAWIDAACASGALVAALGYSEESYDFAAYNMGGTLSNLQFDNPTFARVSETATTLTLDDADIRFDVVTKRADWLFEDFDRVFEHLVQTTGSEADTYDIFGHSAGGQILHRFAIFAPRSRARVIIAANSGFYTFPDLSQALPTGLKGTGLTEADLTHAFSQQLVLMLGALDNSDQAGGTLLHTPLIDGSQGLGRLDRGRSFFEHARDEAERLRSPFHWQVQIIDGIGHDYRAMSAAAADYLMHLTD
jgi:pimeloyl-ACP methyl ester carboxylesterase